MSIKHEHEYRYIYEAQTRVSAMTWTQTREILFKKSTFVPYNLFGLSQLYDILAHALHLGHRT